MPGKMKKMHFVPHIEPEEDFVVRQSDISSPFVCFICKGYLVEAVSITSCLDTFCRSCILFHIEKGRLDCPKCCAIMHPTTPLTVLKADSIKQGLINTLFPHIEIRERQQKEIYYRNRGIPYPHISENGMKRKFKTWKEGLYFVRRFKLNILTVIINYGGPTDPNIRNYPPLEKKYLRISQTGRIQDLIHYITCSLRIHRSIEVSIFLKNFKCNPNLELWKVYQKQKHLNMLDSLPKSDGMRILRVEYVVVKRIKRRPSNQEVLPMPSVCEFRLSDIRLNQQQELERMSKANCIPKPQSSKDPDATDDDNCIDPMASSVPPPPRTRKSKNLSNRQQITTSGGRTTTTFKYPSKMTLLQKRYAYAEQDSIAEPFLKSKKFAQKSQRKECQAKPWTNVPNRGRPKVKMMRNNDDSQVVCSSSTNNLETDSKLETDSNFENKSECLTQDTSSVSDTGEDDTQLKSYSQSPIKSNENGLKIKIKIEPLQTPPKTSKQDLDNYYKWIDKTASVNAANRLDDLKLNSDNKLIKKFYMQFFIEERRLLMSTLKKSAKQNK